MVFRAFPTALWISESLLGRHLPVVRCRHLGPADAPTAPPPQLPLLHDGVAARGPRGGVPGASGSAGGRAPGADGGAVRGRPLRPRGPALGGVRSAPRAAEVVAVDPKTLSSDL